jgi:transcriptional regulator with XRE-family HTH domain
MNYIGRNIKHFRTQLELSQDQLADYLQVKREQVSFIETGKREISVDQLEKLSNLFGVDLEVLLEEDEENLKADIAFAFRSDDLQAEDLSQIADFQKLVKNYLKIQNY